MSALERINSESGSAPVPIELDVKITGGCAIGEYKTHTISMQGFFLLSESPPLMQQVVKLKLNAGAGVFIETMGVVDRVTPPNKATPSEPAGMGIRFFKIEPKWKAAWFRLLGRNAQTKATSVAVKNEMERKSPTAGQVRRMNPRRASRFRKGKRSIVTQSGEIEIKDEFGNQAAETVEEDLSIEIMIRDVRSLIRFVSRQMNYGKVTVAADAAIQSGTDVVLKLPHPISREVMVLKGVVSPPESNQKEDSHVIVFPELTSGDLRAVQRFAITGRVPS
jgi:hypothetical protein